MLNEDDVWVNRLDLRHDNLHVVVFLVNLSGEVDHMVIVQHVSQRVAEYEDSWVLNFRQHSPVCHVLLKHSAIDILALFLVRVLKSDDFDKAVKVNGVVEQTAARADCLDGVLSRLNYQTAPLLAVDIVLFDDLVNHGLNMNSQFLVNPCLH